MKDLLSYGFASENGSVVKSDIGYKLIAEKEKECDEVCSFYLDSLFDTEEYFVMEYKVLGIKRRRIAKAPLVFLLTESGEEALVCCDDLTFDGKEHRVIVKTEKVNASGLRFEFGADRRNAAELTICKMYTCTKNELPVCCAELVTETEESFTALDISAMFNAEFSAPNENVMIDGGRFFEKDEVSLRGIPFKVLPTGKNLIAPDAPPAENDDIIVNFGVPAKRRLCRPISRDSKTEVKLKMNASELFFLFGIKGKRHQRCGFAAKSAIVGEKSKDVTMPLSVDDVERFFVEIVYSDGTHDTALPLNLKTMRHSIGGDMGAYAVPCNGSRVESIVFHNRMLDTDICIAAVTVNNTPKRLFPEMLIPENPAKIERKISRDSNVILNGSVLSVKSGALSFDADISKGIHLLGIKNEYAPVMSAKYDALLKVKTEDGAEISNFDLISASTDERSATLHYRYKELRICVGIAVCEEDGIRMQCNVNNAGEKEEKIGVMFPCFTDVCYTNNSDTWYFFPKYQNINSNETAFIYEESAPSFPMQFFDIYSPSQQGGISITTRERDLTVRKYALEKNEYGVSAFVEYPLMYGDIAAGESVSFSETRLNAHKDDWRKGFNHYKNWLKTWYKPYKCQDKKWYRESFWLLAEITDFFETKEFTSLPVWYDKEKKQCRFKEILEEQKSIAGVYPDILHMWSWAFRGENETFSQQWGNFGSTDYDEYGGVEAFRKALHEVRDMGINISLYLHPTLLSARYPQAEKYFPEYRVINSEGNFHCTAGDSYRMCHANETWREYAISMYPRIYKELGIPLLYVDEFSLRVENRCYSDKHGHRVPSNLLKTDRDFITRLKAAMPEEVVLYGEYYPVDVNAAYIDCNISYYIIDSVCGLIENAWRANDGDDTFSRVYTDVYRFAFPGIVQLILPMAMRGMSWHPQKFIFFNGEAIYDSFWDCEESEGHEFTIKAYKLKKKYADCFSSDNPETMIETLSPAICANRFPGNGRDVYTIYNRAYTTFRGPALCVKHTEGNVYYDVWNEKELDVKISDGYAEISMEIHAQQIGCIEVRGQKYYKSIKILSKCARKTEYGVV